MVYTPAMMIPCNESNGMINHHQHEKLSILTFHHWEKYNYVIRKNKMFYQRNSGMP